MTHDGVSLPMGMTRSSAVQVLGAMSRLVDPQRLRSRRRHRLMLEVSMAKLVSAELVRSRDGSAGAFTSRDSRFNIEFEFLQPGFRCFEAAWSVVCFSLLP